MKKTKISNNIMIKRRILNILSILSIFLFLSCIPILGKNDFSFLGNLSVGLATAKIKDSEKFGYVDIWEYNNTFSV